jgi:hypothetical protein
VSYKVHNVYTITVVERDWNPMPGHKAPATPCVEITINGFYDRRYDHLVAQGSSLSDALENMAKTVVANEL